MALIRPAVYNLGFGNTSLFKQLGFTINYRWQKDYLWQSSLATGTVPAYSTVDAQVQYTFVKSHLNLKLGATNLLNKYPSGAGLLPSAYLLLFRNQHDD